jgi:uncharacterized membrane protein
MTGVLPALRITFAHFHPALVHFPVALLLAGAGMEAFQIVRRCAGRSPVGRVLLGLGAPAALLAVSSGLLLFRPQEVLGRTLEVALIHRFLGLATATAAVCAFFAGGIQRDPGPGGRRLMAYRVLYFTAAVLVGLTGHYGGWIVFGWGKVWPN